MICASPRPRASLNVSVDRLVSTAAAALEESPKGSGVDDDATKEVFPAQEQVSVPVVVDNDAVPEPTSTQSWWKSLQQFPEVTGGLPVEKTSPESDVEASTATLAPDSVNPKVGN